MATYRITTKDDFNKLKRALDSLPRMRLEAYSYAYNRWIDEFLISHFSSGNTKKLGLLPNSPKYDKLKMKLYGHAIQLVRDGKLKQRALDGIARVVGKRVVANFNLPQYADYVKDMKGDFMTPTKQEIRIIRKYFKRRLKQTRGMFLAGLFTR